MKTSQYFYYKTMNMIQNIEYCKLGHENIDQLIHFVLSENYLHHQNFKTAEELHSEQQVLYAEEREYRNSHIFIAVSQNFIRGSIRIFRKQPKQILPLEKIFNIKIQELVDDERPIYHIGRFAVTKGADNNGFRIFKTLMVLALNVAKEDQTGTVFAECDVKLLRTIRLLGIEAEAIGKPIHYLGSETVPIKLPWSGYKNFVNKHRNLNAVVDLPLGHELPDKHFSP